MVIVHKNSRLLLRALLGISSLFLFAPSKAQSIADSKEDRLSFIKRHLVAAEVALRNNHPAVAETEYGVVVAQALTALGILELRDRNFDSAAQLFQDAVRSGSSDEARVLLGIAELFAGRPTQALEVAAAAIKHDPENLSAIRVAAQANILLGNSQEALVKLLDLHARAPNDIEVVYSIATCYLYLKNLNEAKRYFGMMLRVRPQALTHVLVGQAYRDFGYFDQAESELRQALKADTGIQHAHYHLARNSLARQDPKLLPEAAEEFRKELQVTPDDPLANLYLGMVLTKLREYKAAIEPLQRASALDANDPTPLHYLGEAYLHTGRYEEAVRALESAIALTKDPAQKDFQVANTHALLGRALTELGHSSEATVHFEKAKDLKAMAARNQATELLQNIHEPSENAFTAGILAGVTSPEEKSTTAKLREVLLETIAQAYFNLGVMYLNREMFSQAVEHFTSANKWLSGFPQLQFYLGLARYKADEFCAATSPLENATLKDVKNEVAKRLLGLAHFRCENYSQAVAIISSIPKATDDIELQHALGISLVRLGRTEEGSRVFSELLQNNPNNPDVQIILAHAYAQQKQVKEAIASFRKALELNPLLPGVHSSIGKLLLKGGSLTEAEKEFRDELSSYPSDLEAQYLLAFTLDLEGNTDEAVKLLNQLLQKQPNHANARYTLGKILLKKSDFIGALEHLEIAVRIDPNDSSKHFQLGEVYRKLGRREEAERQYETSQELKKRMSKSP